MALMTYSFVVTIKPVEGGAFILFEGQKIGTLTDTEFARFERLAIERMDLDFIVGRGAPLDKAPVMKCVDVRGVLEASMVPPGVSYTDPNPTKLPEPCPDCGGSGRIILFTSEEPCTRCCPS